MDALAVVLDRPEALSFRRLDLPEPEAADLVVATEWSSISTGTERLLWSGRMPPFPGMGYPLVPGYESVGRVIAAGPSATVTEGQRVFVPGARCFGDVKALFGGAASKLVVPEQRVVALPESVGEQGVLLALAATAHHALALDGQVQPADLIIGHGVLGRLMARISSMLGGSPVVWETAQGRRQGEFSYPVLDPSNDDNKYRRIVDVSGDPSCLDRLIDASVPQGEVILAGFYTERMSFDFVPAFLREMSFRVSSEWKRPSLDAVASWVADPKGAPAVQPDTQSPIPEERTLLDLQAPCLDLDGLISHRVRVDTLDSPDSSYHLAFTEPNCLKMVFDWRNCP